MWLLSMQGTSLMSWIGPRWFQSERDKKVKERAYVTSLSILTEKGYDTLSQVDDRYLSPEERESVGSPGGTILQNLCV